MTLLEFLQMRWLLYLKERGIFVLPKNLESHRSLTVWDRWWFAQVAGLEFGQFLQSEKEKRDFEEFRELYRGKKNPGQNA